MAEELSMRFRQRRLDADARGYQIWRVDEREITLNPSETALVLCDVWDRHWCRGAEERLAELLPRMNDVVRSAREKGVLIVHAPSDTMGFYADSPARQRVLAVPAVEPPADLAREDPPQPIDAADGGCDTDRNLGGVDENTWTRQHPAILIDHDRDVISDDGRELFNLYAQRGIRNVIILGVHTNMCILNRSFAIKQMVKWGFTVALVRDLTDSMYNPARPPYVSHDEGTRLTVEYIEKFWCLTLSSDGLL
jgi:nicotinamidase-related amidase